MAEGMSELSAEFELEMAIVGILCQALCQVLYTHCNV